MRNFHQQSRLNSPANLSVSNNLPQLFFAGSRNSFLFIGLHTLCTNQRLYFHCNSINFCSLRTLVKTMAGWHLYRFSSERGRRAVETVRVADGVLVPCVLDGGGIGEKNRRATIRSQCERRKAFGSVRIRMDEFCFPILCHAESVTQEPGQR